LCLHAYIICLVSWTEINYGYKAFKPHQYLKVWFLKRDFLNLITKCTCKSCQNKIRVIHVNVKTPVLFLPWTTTWVSVAHSQFITLFQFLLFKLSNSNSLIIFFVIYQLTSCQAWNDKLHWFIITKTDDRVKVVNLIPIPPPDNWIYNGNTHINKQKETCYDSPLYKISNIWHEIMNWWWWWYMPWYRLGLWCLAPLLTIFQLYCGCQFYCHVMTEIFPSIDIKNKLVN
jgi:hypothetical protein